MTQESILTALSNLHQGRSRGVDAPHKPLLVLYALVQWLRHGTMEFRFADLEQPLGALVRDQRFGGAETATPRDPFWFLRNDGIWIVESATGAGIIHGGDRPSPRELREQEARGRFAPGVVAEVFANRGFALELVGRVLRVYFEPEEHDAVLEALGFQSRE